MTRRDWPYLTEWTDKRTGRFYRRYRRNGRAVPLPANCPKSDREFTEAYHAAAAGFERAVPEPLHGSTVEAIVDRYYRSPEFLNLQPGTTKVYRSILNRFVAEHGSKNLLALEPTHIRSMMADRADNPDAANRILKMLRVVMAFAVENGIRQDNPTIGIKRYRVRSDGFHTWTDLEIDTFERHWPSGTTQRLAFALLLFTAQRRGDVVKMGRQHLEGGMIRVRQGKTDTSLLIPIHPALARELEFASEDLTFLKTKWGKPFTKEGFGGFFRKACDAAGLPKQCAAHGLRKAAARRLAEAGCSTQEIMAMTGHKSLAEVERYTRAVEQGRLASAAILRISDHEK